MMQERNLASKVQGHLKHMGTHSWRHEDHGAGVPDISFQLPGYSGGWIECKILRDECVSNPANTKLSTVLKLTEHQRRWMMQRSQAGGYCCIIAARDHLLIHFNRYIIDHFPRLTLARAMDIGSVIKDKHEFASILKRDMDYQLSTLDTQEPGGTRRVFGKSIREYPHSVTVEKRQRKLDQRQQVL